MAEAFEVATFYAHFDVIDDDDESLPPLQLEFATALRELFGATIL